MCSYMARGDYVKCSGCVSIEIDRMSAPQTSQCSESLRKTDIESHSAEFSQTTHSSPPLHDPSQRLTSISSGQPPTSTGHTAIQSPITPPKQLSKTIRWLLINVADGTRQRKARRPKSLFPIEKKGPEVITEDFLVQKCIDVALF